MKPAPIFDVLAQSLAGTHLVEASAGTGKTFNITTLVVRLLLEKNLEIHQILVVSFARASTADLRGRVRQRLVEAIHAFEAGASLDPVLAALAAKHDRGGSLARLRTAVANFDRAAIYTIHSFCQRALVEFAFESGEPFAVEFVEGADTMYAEVARDHWARTAYEAEEDWLEALIGTKVVTGPDSLADLAKHATERPDLVVRPRKRAEDSGGGVRTGALTPEQLVDLQRELFDVARGQLDQHKNQHNVRAYSDLLVRLSEAMSAPGGEVLADAVFKRFPAALIDEFQDTDPVQFSVFTEVYRGQRGALFLIGDPKQAIYAFRGGDIYAYLRAVGRSPPTTLGVNYRSDRALVEALGQLYQRVPLPFVDPRIPFHPVLADKGRRIRGPSNAAAPLQLKLLRAEGKGQRGSITAGWADSGLAPIVAADIASFLASDARLVRATEGGGEAWEPPLPSDCAVLVRKNADCDRLQRALARHGIPSVVTSGSSVFESDAARELQSVLEAITSASDKRLRAALTSPIFGLSANELADAVADDAAWAGWASHFRGLLALWKRAGFAAVFRSLMALPVAGSPEGAGRAAQARLLAREGGERLVTNLGHLAELMQTREQQFSLTPGALVAWLGARRRGAGDASNDEELRLESDANAVTIMTVYKAKGLQFPVVWVPYGHVNFGAAAQRPVYHDDPPDEPATLSLDPSDWERDSQRADVEATAQERRILYVSLTRAAHRLTVYWGKWNNGEASALAALLHAPAAQPAGREPTRLIEAAILRAKALTEDAMMAELSDVAHDSGGRIAVSWVDEDAPTPAVPRQARSAAPVLDVFRGDIRTSWRRTSYTDITRARGEADTRFPVADHDEGVEDEGPAEFAAGPASPAAAEPGGAGDTSPCLFGGFPRGKRPGIVLHEIFEDTDFAAATDAAPGGLEAAVRSKLAAARIDAAHVQPTLDGLRSVLATSLGAALANFTLGELPRARRLDELAFTFPVSGRGQHAPNLKQAELARFFVRAGLDNLAARVSSLGFGRLRGHLTGKIDLVLEQSGRFYVVDYKSNYLGPTLGDYGQSAMGKEMAHHNYDLQYLLYAVAVHRYLALRLPGYRFADHFGGVRYLFIRGMTPATGSALGVYQASPTESLVHGLSELLRSPGAA